MEIENYKFNFGKYQGLGLMQVYQGSNEIPLSYLRQYLIYRIEVIKNSVLPYSYIVNRMHFEIGDTLMRITIRDKSGYVDLAKISGRFIWRRNSF